MEVESHTIGTFWTTAYRKHESGLAECAELQRVNAVDGTAPTPRSEDESLLVLLVKGIRKMCMPSEQGLLLYMGSWHHSKLH